MLAVEDWDQANFAEEDARTAAKNARKEYQDALGEVLFNVEGAQHGVRRGRYGSGFVRAAPFALLRW
jgi:hypothetical protein